jgi:hypothetical protein
MKWQNCSECGWSYNSDKGGCTNKVCIKYAPGNGSPSTTTPTTSGVGQNVVTQAVGKPSPLTVPNSIMLASSSKAKPPGNDKSSDPTVLSWIATAQSKSSQISPKGVVANGKPFTLTCYRGEKAEWWPPPKMRLVGGGMLLLKPWEWTSRTSDGKNVTSLFTKLAEEVDKQPGFTVAQKVAAYAMYLRAEGREFALATARTGVGSFTSSYDYSISIPNARTFSWGKNLTLGPPVDYEKFDMLQQKLLVNKNVETFWSCNVKSDYIVLNADTLEDSSILGFGHKTGTFEVTFFTPIPLDMVVSCNGTATAALKILTEAELQKADDSPDKQKALNLLRFKAT